MQILLHKDDGTIGSGTEMCPISDLDHIIETFGTLDKDGDGVLNVADITGLLSTTGGHLTEEEAQGIIAIADVNKDGTLDIHEFVRLVTEPALAEVSWRLRSGFRAILVIGGPGSGKGLVRFCSTSS